MHYLPLGIAHTCTHTHTSCNKTPALCVNYTPERILRSAVACHCDPDSPTAERDSEPFCLDVKERSCCLGAGPTWPRDEDSVRPHCPSCQPASGGARACPGRPHAQVGARPKPAVRDAKLLTRRPSCTRGHVHGQEHEPCVWLAQAQRRWETSVPVSPRPPPCAGGVFLGPAGAHDFLFRYLREAAGAWGDERELAGRSGSEL